MDNIAKLAERIRTTQKTVVLTGAGISTESGISDYRSQGGLWQRFQPVYFDEFCASAEARDLYWERKREMIPQILAARPNPAHLALGRMHEMGHLSCVLTQNIDGLHQDGGVPDDAIVELHGTNRSAYCLDCDHRMPIEEVMPILEADPGHAPACPSCGGRLKPATISFGQSLNPEDLARASQEAMGADVMIAIGSTLIVQPVAELPVLAKQNGAFLAILNLSETPLDGIADVLIDAKAGEVLPRVVEMVEAG